MIRVFKSILFKLFDWVLLPFSMLYLPLLKLLRKNGLSNFPAHQKLLHQNSVYPLIDHYYDPRINYEKDFDFSSARNLHINWNIDGQLACLGGLKGVDELRGLPRDEGSTLSNSHNPLVQTNSPRRFYFNNPAFSDGDADIYYLMIRNLKPKRIIEIGSGFSTLMAVEAIQKNKEEQHDTVLTCIEPYEFSWLEHLPEVKVLRERVENIPIDYFYALEAGDILFIDSSHIIRPGNDVLFEYLHILPALKKGVVVHIHDIFSPKHYPKEWMVNQQLFWNEQYLLEAFLYYNNSYTVKLALNLLKSQYFDALKTVCPGLLAHSEPGSFWIEKTN